MDFRRIEIDCETGKLKDIGELDGADAIAHCREEKTEKGFKRLTLLVRNASRQKLLDAIEKDLHNSKDWRVVVLPVDGVLPLPDEDEAEKNEDAEAGDVTREEIFNQVQNGASIGIDVAVLLAASAIVACGGMLNDSVPIVIGAMLIAPMLGPILSLVLGNALGERWLILRSLLACVGGIVLVLAIGAAAGLWFSYDVESRQIVNTTSIGFEDIVLALASGVAAALSVTSGQVTVLVGVMVAAALLPPVTAAGILFGGGEYLLASRAFLLALTNIVCINLAGQLVFLWKGVRPRTWYQQKQAKQSVAVSIGVLAVSLILLTAAIYFLR
ncbi:MAG: TIGR00341 family protein [Rhodobiaceae bacterium]|nr:TIGR00341 family protein [Rhodobiaceae bacterium]